MHSVTLDVDEVGKGTYTDSNGRVVVPEARPAKLPAWVSDYVNERVQPGNLGHGTVVVIENLDRLSWKTKDSLARHLKEHFGVTYRNFLRQANISVDGDAVEPVDPLFLTPGARYYDLDEDRARALPPMQIKVKDPNGKKAAATSRFGLLSCLRRFSSTKGTAGVTRASTS